MTAQLGLELAGGNTGASIITWRREAGTHWPRYLMLAGGAPNGWTVRHCGHHTALTPWWIDAPSLPNVRTFKRATEAMAAAEALIKGRMVAP